MILEFDKNQRFQLIEESRIETTSGGIVQGQDLHLGRTVAVKYVNIPGTHPKERELAYNKAFSEVRAMIRLEEEQLSIPHIFDTYYDEKASTLYIIMEWMKGTTLDNHMAVPELTFLQWMIDLSHILSVMERKRMSHKDIKPTNLIITPGQKLVLIDFNTCVSTANLVEGTAYYKAPEMAPTSKYTGREKVDMFAIGVMLYQYYTGAVPTKGVEYGKNRTRGAYVWDFFVEPIERNPTMSQGVNQLIKTCMALEPRERYRDNHDLRNQLTRVVKKIRWEQKKR